MKAYKGFNSKMQCRGFQFEEGKTYEEPIADLCHKGFHACEAPLDVFGYYPPVADDGTLNKYHEVELEEVSDKTSVDTNRVARKIKIGAELNISNLVKAHVEYVKEHVGDKKEDTGYGSAASNTGYRSAASNTGYRSAASNTGYGSAASNTGNYSAASNTGYGSAASNTGVNGIAVAWGAESKAKGAKGCYIVLSEWGDYDSKKQKRPLKYAKMFKVDGKKIKADTFYKLVGGNPVEVK